MSHTRHHRSWWKREEDGERIPRYHQRYGYEWGSGRPKTQIKATRGWYNTGSYTKHVTAKTERRWEKEELRKELENVS